MSFALAPANPDAILTITTDRGTIEAWVVFGEVHTATARFINAEHQDVTRYIYEVDGCTSAVAGHPPRWSFIGDDGTIRRVSLSPPSITHAVDLRRAAEAALVMNGSRSKP